MSSNKKDEATEDSGEQGLALTPEVIKPGETDLPAKSTAEIIPEEKKSPPSKLIRKWTEYSRIWREKGLKPRQVKAIKSFILQEFKSVAEWSRSCGVPHRTLLNWIHQDQVFKEALIDLCTEELDVYIPFGLKKMGKRIKDGDETSLMRALGLRGRLEKQQERKGVYRRFIAEWLEPE